MKVLGFVVILLGLIMVYVGITGSQHTLMATITGSTNPKASGQAINPSGSSSGTITETSSNLSPATSANNSTPQLNPSSAPGVTTV